MSDPPTRLNAALEGRYHIESELGEGGMATVYLADDLKHERRVALKVLRPELAAVVGAERFLAEIKTTANLTHPNILPLHDSGEAGGFLFYVMPFVAGETLRDRLERERQLPVDDAVRIASDVAEALEYAHSHGVIHRDIKPANILLQAGRPLISDFGIALAVSAGGGGRLTETGLSLGTPHYMSPEQATGDTNVGAATDVWALGCVLYEMLVGAPPITGSTPQAILGKIIGGEPPSAVAERSSVPANVDAVIRRALERVPADRFESAREAALALRDEAFRHGRAEVGPAARRRLTFAAVGGWAAAIVLAVAWLIAGDTDEAPAPAWLPNPFLASELPDRLGFGGYAMSRDGGAIVYRKNPDSYDDSQFLMLRRWDTLHAVPLQGTEAGNLPALSYDARELAFVQRGQVKAMSLPDGAVRDLAEGRTPRWGPRGDVYVSGSTGVLIVPSSGGDSARYLTRISDREERHTLWDFLPDGETGLMWVDDADGGSEVRTVDIVTGEMLSLGPGQRPQYVESGHLIYLSPPNTMMAVRFDARAKRAVGEPIVVMSGVLSWTLSSEGRLYYSRVSAGANTDVGTEYRTAQLLWVTRSGEAAPIDADWVIPIGSDDGSWRLSPDGSKLALRERTETGYDIFIKDLRTGARVPLTRHEARDRWPEWRPESDEVSFISNRNAGGFNVWIRSADRLSDPTLLLDIEPGILTTTWGPRGEWLVLRAGGIIGVRGGRDIYGFRPGVDSTVIPLLADPDYEELNPDVSPDGRYIAYQTNESGRDEVELRPFPDVDSGRWAVSIDGGRNPRWANSGREIFFQSPRNEMMVVDIDPDADHPVQGAPRLLFEPRVDWIHVDIYGLQYEVGPDDQRFIIARMISPGDVGSEETGVLVLDFAERLRQLLPN